MRENISVLEFGTLIFFANLLRYILLAGTAFLVFYVIFKKKFLLSKIQQKFPQNKDYFREIGYSFITFLIFTLVGVGLYNPMVRPYTNTYYQISEYGYFYLFLSFFLMIIMHDTYFYWAHRFMHHPKVFRFFHHVHHPHSVSWRYCRRARPQGGDRAIADPQTGRGTGFYHRQWRKQRRRQRHHPEDRHRPATRRGRSHHHRRPRLGPTGDRRLFPH